MVKKLIKRVGALFRDVLFCCKGKPGRSKAIKKPKKNKKKADRSLKKPRLPFLVVDLDGVIKKEETPIGNAPQIIQKLLSGPHELPFMFLTNNGGSTEE